MRLAIVAAMLLSTAPAFALDAVTYRGTLGEHDIVVELTEPGAGAVVGRYSYMAKGGDIPLNSARMDDDLIVLSEEAPCTEDACATESGDALVGATWTLSYDTEGGLRGNWQPAKKGDVLDVALTEIGRRTLPDNAELSPYGLYDSTVRLTYGGREFTAQAAPYEFAKMDVPLHESAVETLEGSTFRYVTDPRTEFAFPRIVSLVDGSSPNAANAALAARHATINSYAFDCLTKIYGGFGARSDMLHLAAGTLGSYDEEVIAVAYLSPTLMGWTEKGSTFCLGAYPNNHFDSHIIDVKRGETFAMSKVFRGWKAIANDRNDAADRAEINQAEALTNPDDDGWLAGQALIDYVIANRDMDDESDCYDVLEELIASNLGVRFAPDDQVIFSLVDLPHVSFACTQDLLTVKLSDIPDLLTPGARDYFPSLTN